ncbi:hypothetical protein BSR28_01285 [Boudabousia liubingyangii]|nr:hypothetical protein BSR28_01285 [Boudabousia liubingyangii]
MTAKRADNITAMSTNNFNPQAADQALAALNDPNLAPELLGQIATYHPEMWAKVAEHPRLYPALEKWLAEKGGPEVQEALKNRTSGNTPAAAPVAAAPQAPAVSSVPQPSSGTSVPESSSAASYQPGNGQHSYQASAPAASGMSPVNFQEPKSGGKRKGVIALVIALVVALVAGVGGWLYFSGVLSARGAESPKAAMGQFSEAIEDLDVTKAATVMAPSETDFFVEIMQQGAKAGGQKNVDPVKLMSDLSKTIEIKNDKFEYEVAEKNDNLAVVSINEWSAKVTVKPDFFTVLEDTEGLPPEVKEQIAQAKEQPLPEDELVTFVNEGSKPIRVVMVQEGGKWFVSPMMTFAENARSPYSEPNYEYDPASDKGAESAEDVIKDIVELGSSSRSGDDLLYSPKFRGLMELPIRRLMGVYGDDPGKAAARTQASNFDVDWKLNTAKGPNGTTIVSMGETIFTDPSGNKIEFSDGKMKITNGAESKTLDLARTLVNPDQLGFATIQEDGTWRLSLTQSYVNLTKLELKDGVAREVLEEFSQQYRNQNGYPSDAMSQLLSDEETLERVVDAFPGLITMMDIGIQLQELAPRNSVY